MPALRDAKLPPPELRFETFENVVDSSVYSPNDKDVDPPVVLYPQQLGRVPIGLRREEIAFVEIIINEEGRVMQVKARESTGDARRVHGAHDEPERGEDMAFSGSAQRRQSREVSSDPSCFASLTFHDLRSR